MRFSLRTLLASSVAIAALATAPSAFAASITIKQSSPIETIGSWTLIYPSSQTMERKNKEVKVESLIPGRYTLIIRPPEGMITSLELLRGNEVVQESDHPQLSFEVAEADEFMLSITYDILEGGSVGVSSHPAGVRFELTGPDGYKAEGITPGSYMNMPQGNYSVRYFPGGSCPQPPATSGRMGQEKRVDFSIDIVCSSFEPVKDRESEIVQTKVNGVSLSFIDVPSDAWFAPYVSTVSRRGILTGYRDDNGGLSGRFGPENPVTIAELSKITHEMGAANENTVTITTMNEHAKGTWFEKYFASAEDRGWLVFLDPELDPSRPATRAEVIVTLLQAIDVPVEWPSGRVFTDVLRRTRYSGAIETAAEAGIIDSGDADHQQFHPENPINRAEISKILIAIQEKYPKKFERGEVLK